MIGAVIDALESLAITYPKVSEEVCLVLARLRNELIWNRGYLVFHRGFLGCFPCHRFGEMAVDCRCIWIRPLGPRGVGSLCGLV